MFFFVVSLIASLLLLGCCCELFLGRVFGHCFGMRYGKFVYPDVATKRALQFG